MLSASQKAEKRRKAAEVAKLLEAGKNYSEITATLRCGSRLVQEVVKGNLAPTATDPMRCPGCGHKDGSEVATAIAAWLVSHGVHVSGPRTITVNGELCESGNIYVDPTGFVITPSGDKLSGRGVQ